MEQKEKWKMENDEPVELRRRKQARETRPWEG
jgi:hypothetical protein